MADAFRAPTLRAQLYYEQYKSALALYEDRRFFLCKQRCLELLESTYLPRLTKCETLQLAAACSYHYEARRLLLEALVVCDEMEATRPEPLIQKLRDDIASMLHETEVTKTTMDITALVPELEFDELTSFGKEEYKLKKLFEQSGDKGQATAQDDGASSAEDAVSGLEAPTAALTLEDIEQALAEDDGTSSAEDAVSGSEAPTAALTLEDIEQAMAEDGGTSSTEDAFGGTYRSPEFRR